MWTSIFNPVAVFCAQPNQTQPEAQAFARISRSFMLPSAARRAARATMGQAGRSIEAVAWYPPDFC